MGILTGAAIDDAAVVAFDSGAFLGAETTLIMSSKFIHHLSS